jgi:hypothetical protein
MEKVLKEERARILQEGEELIRTFNGHYRRKSVKISQSELILRKGQVREGPVPHLARRNVTLQLLAKATIFIPNFKAKHFLFPR